MKVRFGPSLMSAVAFAICLPSLRLAAEEDVLELRDGKVLKGTFAGGTAGAIRFRTAEGEKTFTREEVTTITFATSTTATPTDTPGAAASSSSAPAPATGSVTVPAGTLLLVKMATGVSSTDPAGRRFEAELQNAIEKDGKVVAPPGTKVYGSIQQSQAAGRMAGKSSLQLTLNELNLGGKTVPIVTGDFAEAGKSSFRKTARNTGVGAAIGAAAGGGKGAATGAAIGAGTAIIRKGESVTVPPGALLEFRLMQPLTMPANGK